MAPSSTSGNSTNPEAKQTNFFKLGKASDDVNESGSFSINLQLIIFKVDSIFKVFNAGRLSKESKSSNLSTLRFENNGMHDGRILICVHKIPKILQDTPLIGWHLAMFPICRSPKCGMTSDSPTSIVGHIAPQSHKFVHLVDGDM